MIPPLIVRSLELAEKLLSQLHARGIAIENRLAFWVLAQVVNELETDEDRAIEEAVHRIMDPPALERAARELLESDERATQRAISTNLPSESKSEMPCLSPKEPPDRYDLRGE